MSAGILLNTLSDVNSNVAATEIKKLKQENTFTKESFEMYLNKQRIELQNIVQVHPDREIHAGVSFKKLMSQEEIDSITSANKISVEYFEYKATNGISGGAATVLYKDISEAAEHLKKSRGAEITGITYIFAKGKASDVQNLSKNNNVILTDVGFLKEIDEQKTKGITMGQSLPPNLYAQHQIRGINVNSP